MRTNQETVDQLRDALREQQALTNEAISAACLANRKFNDMIVYAVAFLIIGFLSGSILAFRLTTNALP